MVCTHERNCHGHHANLTPGRLAAVTVCIMVSNGLSSRRRTLKRPIVCKSKEGGLCGNCELTVEAVPPSIAVNGSVLVTATLSCDKMPVQLDFTLTMVSDFTPPAFIPPLTPTLPSIFTAVAPATPGEYGIQITAINSTGCVFQASTLVQVTT